MFSANFYEDHYFIFLCYTFCHRIFSKEIFTYATILRLSLYIFHLGALLFWISYFGLWFNTFDFCVWCEVGAGFLFLSHNYLVVSVLFVEDFFFPLHSIVFNHFWVMAFLFYLIDLYAYHFTDIRLSWLAYLLVTLEVK